MTERILRWAGRLKPVPNLWVLLVFFLFLGTSLLAVNFLWVFERMNSRFTDLCEEARSEYERGGSGRLRPGEPPPRIGPGFRAHLLDADGRDIVTGEDRSPWLASKPNLPLFSGPPAHRRVGQTGAYSCVVAIDARLAQFRPPPALWFLLFLSVLCCTVAAYVTVRMRRIETAVTHFGSGKLGLRMTSHTRDPFGRLSKAFNQMADRIESLVDAHKRLCIDISHELRSPLTRLRMAVRLARAGSQRALDQIETDCVRLNDLVEELLKVTAAEVDPTGIRSEPVDVQFLLTEITDHCVIEAREKGCEFDLRFGEPGCIPGDLELLRRAIENVLRNAIRHSPPGQPIELRVHCDLSHAVLSVRDRGHGVPDCALEDIFQPFYRVESGRDRNSGGVGLGLAIAKRAIMLHRGSVTAQNAAPGLRVEIRLPRTERN